MFVRNCWRAAAPLLVLSQRDEIGASSLNRNPHEEGEEFNRERACILLNFQILLESGILPTGTGMIHICCLKQVGRLAEPKQIGSSMPAETKPILAKKVLQIVWVCSGVVRKSPGSSPAPRKQG